MPHLLGRAHVHAVGVDPARRATLRIGMDLRALGRADDEQPRATEVDRLDVDSERWIGLLEDPLLHLVCFERRANERVRTTGLVAHPNDSASATGICKAERGRDKALLGVASTARGFLLEVERLGLLGVSRSAGIDGFEGGENGGFGRHGFARSLRVAKLYRLPQTSRKLRALSGTGEFLGKTRSGPRSLRPG